MRAGQRLDYVALAREAREAVAKSGRSQKWIAERLGINEATVSKALNETRGVKRYAQTQADIIAAVQDDYVIEGPIFRVVRRG